MTAKELLKYKWHQFVIVSELLWLRSEKYNKLVIVDLLNWMTFPITTLSTLFTSIPHPLQSQSILYNH